MQDRLHVLHVLAQLEKSYAMYDIGEKSHA